MNPTDDLIRQLAARAVPVRPLAPAWLRACAWLLVSAGVIVLATSFFGMRPQWPDPLRDPVGGLEWFGGALTGVLAAAALSSAGVSLFHVGETAAMVLVGHLLAVLVLSALCALASRVLFRSVGAWRPLL